MPFPLPQRWDAGWLVVTKCETNPTGGTDVECTFLDVPLAPFSFADYDVDRDGFDQLKNRIESEALDQVAKALRADE